MKKVFHFTFSVFFALAALVASIAVSGCDESGSCAPSDPFCNPEMFAVYTNLLPTTTTLPAETTKYKAKFIYLHDGTNIYSYSVDSSTGAIVANNGIALGTVNMNGIVSHPGGTHAVVYHHFYSTDPNISKHAIEYSIGTGGALTAAGGSVATDGPSSAEFWSATGSKDSGILYLDDGNATTYGVPMYDWTPGSLTARAESPLGPSVADTTGEFNTAGTAFFALDMASDNLHVYRRASTNDPFSESSVVSLTFPDSSDPSLSPEETDVYFSTSEHYLYHFHMDTPQSNPVQVSVLGPLGSGNNIANDPRITPDGKYLYVPISASDQIYGYTREVSSGSLSPLPGMPLGTINGVRSVKMDPGGKFMYLLGDNSTGSYAIQIYTIGSDGSITEQSGSPYILSHSIMGDMDLVTEPFTTTESP